MLFLAFLLAFGALIGSAWVLFAYYIPYKKEVLYPGFAIFGQNVAIFLRSVCRSPVDPYLADRWSLSLPCSTLTLKFGRKEDLGY